MPNPENIEKYKMKPGETLNPNGRPKGVQNSKTRMLRLLDLTQQKKNVITGAMEDFSVLEQMDMALIAKALKGDIAAYREILDRIEGKPAQPLTGADGEGLMPTTTKHTVIFKKMSK